MGVRFPFDLDRARDESAGVVLPESVASPADLVGGARTIGVVAGDFGVSELTVDLSDSLQAAGVDHVTDLHPVIDEWRAVKDPWEHDWQAEAGRVAAHALAAAGVRAQVGDTDFAIASRVEAAARSAGSGGCLCLVGIGAGAVMTEPTGRVVSAGDPVNLEITLYHRAACTHVNGTLLPEADAGHAEALSACRAARVAILDNLRPGVAVAEVVAAGDAVLAAHDLAAYKEYDFGHGLGCDTPEHPVLQPQVERDIDAGNILAVHVAVRVPDGPTAAIGGPVAVDRQGAVELVPDASWVGA